MCAERRDAVDVRRELVAAMSVGLDMGAGNDGLEFYSGQVC